MATVKEIESAIQGLSKSDLSTLRTWFREYDAAVWDKEFEKDALSGRLDSVSAQAIADFKSGKCKKL